MNSISKRPITKLVGLKKEDFDQFVKSGQIQVQSARLIPTLKTGDEMALTSIFLSTVHLVKEYRDDIFKEIKLSRFGKAFYYTEVSFPEINKSRIDGLIIVVSSGVIVDAVFFEMKNKNNGIDKDQIETYLEVSKKLKVGKLVTVSNEFVADSSHSPVAVRPPKNVSLFHFSWTNLITKGRLLLFKNNISINDVDQVEIMREALYYLESSVSGICGFTQMKVGWKELSENIHAQKPLKVSDKYIEDAVCSWYEEEKDMALLMSRKLGVLVKSTSKNKDSVKNDIRRIVKENFITGNLSIKDSVSDIKITAEFERRVVSMSVKIKPPLNKGNVAKITWLNRQLENCNKKNASVFSSLEGKIWIEADVKFARENLKVKLSDLASLADMVKGKDIQAFHIVVINGFGVGFASNKKFIVLIEQMILEYYETIVQYLYNWKRPAPKIEEN